MPASTHEDRLPRFVLDQLSACPSAGSGVNNWLFRTARVLHHYRQPDEIIALLAINSHNCGRSIPKTELFRAVKNSQACAWHPGQLPEKTGPLWPLFDRKAREAVLPPLGSLADLFESSPVKTTDAGSSEEILTQIFPKNSLLCCGHAKDDGCTMPIADWVSRITRKETPPYIVPSPMSKVKGRTAEGRESYRCLDNTGPRRFLVIEQDIDSLDEQAAFLLHLKTLAPLALAVHSGHKSIHGWFYCNGRGEDKLETFMRYCVKRGADRATWPRCQWVRMPNAQREDYGNLQKVYYFDPRVIK